MNNDDYFLKVFTNFFCFAPITFFGLTALAGHPVIDPNNLRILLCVLYPINSCANPYLYAILCVQHRRDFFLLLSKFGICQQRAQQHRIYFSYQINTLPLNISQRGRNYVKRRQSIEAVDHKIFVEENVNTTGIVCDTCV